MDHARPAGHEQGVQGVKMPEQHENCRMPTNGGTTSVARAEAMSRFFRSWRGPDEEPLSTAKRPGDRHDMAFGTDNRAVLRPSCFSTGPRRAGCLMNPKRLPTESCTRDPGDFPMFATSEGLAWPGSVHSADTVHQVGQPRR